MNKDPLHKTLNRILLNYIKTHSTPLSKVNKDCEDFLVLEGPDVNGNYLFSVGKVIEVTLLPLKEKFENYPHYSVFLSVLKLDPHIKSLDISNKNEIIVVTKPNYRKTQWLISKYLVENLIRGKLSY